MKRNKVYKALDGRLIEVTTMGELSLGRPKGGGGRLIGGLISHSFLHLFRDFDYRPLNGGSNVLAEKLFRTSY